MAGVNPEMVIRIAANVEELKKNLAEGKASIEALGPSVKKLTDTWERNSGVLIQNARNIVAAVDKVGASTLTAADAAKNLKVLEAAMEQIARKGQPVPPIMADTAAKLREVTKTIEPMPAKTGEWTASLKSLATAFGITFSIGTVVAFARSLLQMGDEIVRVADRTGLTTEEVQRLGYIAEQSGNTLDELTGAIGQMQNRLASGDTSAIAAVEMLKINLASLKDASPFQQMGILAAEIAKIPDPAIRAQIAMDLFGRTGIAILPTLTANFAALGKEAPVMSDKTTRALEQAGDQLGRFGLQIKVWAAESYNFIRGAFDAVIAITYKGVEAFYRTTAAIVGLTAKIPGAAKTMGLLGIDVKGLTDKAQWYSDAAAGMAIRTDEVAASATRLIPPMDTAGKQTDKAGKAADAYRKSVEDLRDQLSGAALEGDLRKLYDAYKKLSWQEWTSEGTVQRVVEAYAKLRDKVKPSALPAELEALYWELIRIDGATIPLSNKVTYGLVPAFSDASDAIDDLVIAGARANAAFQNMPTGLVPVSGGIQRVTVDVKELSQALGAISSDFAQLSQIGGEGFLGGFAQGAAETIKLVEQGVRLMESYSAMTTASGGQGLSAANYASLAAGMAGIAILAYQIGQQMNEAAERDFTFTMERMQTLFEVGTRFSDQLAQAIEDDYDALSENRALVDLLGTFDNLTQATERYNELAESLNLSGIIEELGGISALTETQVAGVYERMTDLFTLIEAGGPLGARAIEELDENLVAFGEAAVANGGIVDQFFIDTIRRAEEAGVSLAGVNDFILGQLGSAASGLNALFTGFSGTLQVTEQSAAGLSAAVVGTFGEMIARGASLSEALKAVQPAIDSLGLALGQAGLDGGAAFTTLSQLSLLAADDITGPLVDGIQGANQALLGLTNSGLMNQEMFGGIASTATQAYNQIIAQGGDGNAAMMAMQPTLQTIWNLQEQFGYSVDDATQSLLDQAEASGIVGAQFQTDAQRQTAALESINQSMGQLVDFFQRLLPQAAQNGASAVTSAASSMSAAIDNATRDRTMKVNIETSGSVPDIPSSSDYAALGGLVTSAGVQYLARGAARILPFLPRGTDTIPAMLTPGESVITRSGTSMLGVDTVRDLNHGGAGVLSALQGIREDLRAGSGGGEIVLNVALELDGQVLDRRVVRVTKQGLQDGSIAVPARSVLPGRAA